MRRAPSSRGRDDALRISVFDAAHQIGLSDPNALRWLEQNSHVIEEEEEEEGSQRETRPPSDTHPPSLVFSTSSSEHDSSIASPSNDHSTNYRAPYPRPATKAPHQAYPHAPFRPDPQLFAQPHPEVRSPFGSNTSSPRITPAQPPVPLVHKQLNPWPTQLAIASLSPPSQPNSRAPSPGDKGNSKQTTESKKSRKLTKAQRTESEPEVVPSRKASASGESGSPTVGGAAPTLPFLPFPSSITGDTLGSDASVSGLSAISGVSGSSSGTVTQFGTSSTIFPSSRASNEPRSFFEDDDDVRPAASSSNHGHTHNSPSTSTANSADNPSHGKDKEGRLLRTMRSFKLSLKGQKAPKPSTDAPAVPSVPSLPPVLTLELDKGAGLDERTVKSNPKAAQDMPSQAKEKDREERVLKIAEMFTSEITRNTRSGSEAGNVSSVYTTQSHSELGHGVQSDLGHTTSKHQSGSDFGHAVHSDLGHAPIRIAGASRGPVVNPVVARRRSVNELDAGVGEATKATERTRAGTVGVRTHTHTRTRSKSGDFTGIGWEKGSRPPVPVPNGNAIVPATVDAPAQPVAAEPAAKPPTRFFVTNPTRSAKAPKPTQAKPPGPNPSLNGESKQSLERHGSSGRGQPEETRASEVQHQLQSFIASMRGAGEDDDGSLESGFGRTSGEAPGRNSEDSRPAFARLRAQGGDSDTVRSSGEYDPFRTAPKPRFTAANLPRPESEALPHQFIIPASELPKELGQIAKPVAPAPAKRSVPPVAFRSPEKELPSGLVRTSSVSARPSVIISSGILESTSAEVAEVRSPEDKSIQKDETGKHARPESAESEFGLGYGNFNGATVEEPVAEEPQASEDWVVPSPSWAPLDPKRGRSASGGSAGPDTSEPLDPPIRPGQFLDVRMDRQRASGLSIPRSVTPDSPRPLLIPPRPVMNLPPGASSPLSTSRSTTPLAPSRSVTPLGPPRSATTPVLARSVTPQPARETTPPQAQPVLSPQARRPQLIQRNTPSPPIPRNTLPTRSSSISSVSSAEHSAGHGTRSPAPRTVMARLNAPVSRPSTASSVQSAASTSSSRGPLSRSMSTTPTPREEPLPHEQLSRFLDPEAVPVSQKRGRVSPFPVKPLREPSRDRLRETTEQPSQREKYPGGAEKYGSDGLMQVPRVRFIGVRSSNGSSQAGWQARMEDMDMAESPLRSEAWHEESRPVSWQEFEEPSYSSYDEATEEDVRYSTYEDVPQEDDARVVTRTAPMSAEASPDVVAALGALRPPTQEQPPWAIDETAPASRASTFTLASVYDDEDDVPPVPKTERLAAAVRGMGQNGWAAGRI